MPKLSVSVVSHRSGHLLPALLADLGRTLPANTELLLTLNVPEDEDFLLPFVGLQPRLIRNAHPQGFGQNHNKAFAASTGEVFVVVNPDIRLPESPFAALLAAVATPNAGACAPVVLSPRGTIEDSVRRFPTLGRLLRRVVLRQRHADYEISTGTAPLQIDWAAGMFVAFPREAFARVGGFDARYFMYFEDADICRRLWRAGYRVELVPAARVIHDAQRTSHRNPTHLRWHLRSALRFLVGI